MLGRDLFPPHPKACLLLSDYRGNAGDQQQVRLMYTFCQMQALGVGN